jgi:hypothetical protein
MSNLAGKVVATALGAATVLASSLGVDPNVSNPHQIPSPSQAAATVIEELSNEDKKRKEMEGR